MPGSVGLLAHVAAKAAGDVAHDSDQQIILAPKVMTGDAAAVTGSFTGGGEGKAAQALVRDDANGRENNLPLRLFTALCLATTWRRSLL